MGHIRLLSVQLLPREADDATCRAYDDVLARRVSVGDIWSNFAAELQRLDLAPVSKAAFYRWAQRVRRGEVRRPKPSASAAAGEGRAALAGRLRALADDIEHGLYG